PEKQFDKALNGEIMFDGSSIEGFVRIEESDMLLKPDLDTFRVLPWEEEHGRVARIICDVYDSEEKPFAGCPRVNLKRVIAMAEKKGYCLMAGPEAEFFLFLLNEKGDPTINTHDDAGYFDLGPTDKGEECRQAIVNALEKMGFEVEAAHHEVAPGQHEIDFKYADALTTADNIATFKLVVRRMAAEFGLHATFMPKPVAGINGSGMHTHQSLFKNGKNAFHDPKGKYQISDIGLWYIGGLLAHAKGMCAVTNPSINSYKRLLPGYEAPTNITWSERNRSPLARVPARRGVGTRVELRMPDPSCNPYLAVAVMLRSGLDGIEKKIDPGEPVNKNIFEMSHREKRRLRIDDLPPDLEQALKALKKDEVVQDALTPHIYENFLDAKETAWHEYIAVVHPWELDRYLARY
ncbi:MAG: type I glutamate--ammonia ligase, partial [Deltaproteobacteria bacterium]|nr:type I glutamate--ammonia ligase [Deltaproteobacteria bacterium]